MKKRITPSPITMVLKIIVQTIDNKSSIHKILAFTPSYSLILLLSVPHWLLGLTSKNSLKKKKERKYYSESLVFPRDKELPCQYFLPLKS